VDNNDTNLDPIEQTDAQRRTIILAMTGVVAIGLCALFLIAFLWFRPGETSLFAQYFPSATATVKPSSTPAPTRTPAPNLTATQLAWVRPVESPLLGTVEDAENALASNATYIEYYAVVYSDTPEVNQPGDVYIFEVVLEESEPLLWSYGWCTTTPEILEQNFAQMKLLFSINQTAALVSNFAVQDEIQSDDSRCRSYNALVNRWPPGVHHLEVQITFSQPTDDGWNTYPAGTHTFKYIVTVEN
jgi:hypothetical protein